MTKEEFLSKIELQNTIESRPFNKEEITKKLDKKMILNNRDVIFNFFEKYDPIYFRRIEKKSGDTIIIRIFPMGFTGQYWEDVNIKVMEIGKILNAAGTIEIFYMSEEGFFYNQTRKLIFGNEEDFLNYLLTVEYDYHPVIADITYSRLKDAGWYEGRKIDISKLVDDCAADGVVLSQKQIEFIQEFCGICGVGFNNREFVISDKIKWKYFKRANEMRIADYKEDTLCIGCFGDGMMPLWITADGLLVRDDGIQLGRTIMEGFNCFLGRV